MTGAFRHLYMAPELAFEFLALFSRIEYALKATGRYANGSDAGVSANWDLFANEIDRAFCAISDEQFVSAVDYLLRHPPRKQILVGSTLTFADQHSDHRQARAQQTLVFVRRVRNNLFHGGKYLPDGARSRTKRTAGLVFSHRPATLHPTRQRSTAVLRAVVSAPPPYISSSE